MLQIRLSKGNTAGDGAAGTSGGTAGSKGPAPASETVTVACPDHLVIADLPVAKTLGAVTTSSSANTTVRTVGRRSRRVIGERIHFCARCDFPIAIYGRLTPCEHAFCLTCARSDATCYLCDERIQKIQSIKMMEGIFLCAAPRCLKSFLKQSELGTHIYENHANLFHSNEEDENDKEVRESSIDTQKQSAMQEISTARAPAWPGFSPGFSSQHHDHEEKIRRNQSNDQLAQKLPAQAKPPQFHNLQQRQDGDPQVDNNTPQGFDRPHNWINQPQGFDNQSGPGLQHPSTEKPAGVPLHSSFSDYQQMQNSQHSSYSLPMNANQTLPPQIVNYPSFPADGSQTIYGAPFEIARAEMVQAGTPGQGLSFPPSSAGLPGFVGNMPRAWGMGLFGMPFDPSMMMNQGISDGYTNQADTQGRHASLQGDVGNLSGGMLPTHSQMGQLSELHRVSPATLDNKGMLAQLKQSFPVSVQLPPPPPLPLPSSQQHNAANFSAFGNVNQEFQGYGWQKDKE